MTFPEARTLALLCLPSIVTCRFENGLHGFFTEALKTNKSPVASLEVSRQDEFVGSSLSPR